MRDNNLLDFDIMDTMVLPEAKELEEDAKDQRVVYLDPSFCNDFRDAINSSPIFADDPEYMARYHLCCAVMDRLDTCIERLNAYGDYPASEEDFLMYMMFAAMATDAVKEILDKLDIHKKNAPIYNSDEDYKYFKSVYEKSPLYNPNTSIPTDEEFFQYFRSLSFAHPVETSRHKFKRKDEVQYSPWVIVNRHIFWNKGYDDPVGVRIYTSLSEEIIHLVLSFADLKEYVRSRYERIMLATKWAYIQIENAKSKWRKTKVNRKQPPLSILIEIDNLLTARFENNYSIRDAIGYLKCDLTDQSNYQSVEVYRKAIVSVIPKICDAVDNLNHVLAEELCDELYKRPPKMHDSAHYQLEKIFSYLGDNLSPNASSECVYALGLAKDFSEGFAKKWVTIDTENMSYTEIKLLVRTACYLERLEQEQCASQNNE